MDDAKLLVEARRARDRARAPYSRFPVGAAAIDATGRVFHGCNVENASYGLAMCAERVALFRAVVEGAAPIRKIAVVADVAGPVRPCGACRQVMAELAPGARVVMGNLGEAVDVATVEDLLPKQFEF